MRTTVTLDDDIYDLAVRMSQASGDRLGKVLSNLARQGLNPPAAIRKARKSRFPTFYVPPGTPPMSLKDIEAFLEEEGHF
ncbi:MAG: hypothetical protein R2729_14745 [Bryobacteraceae bacterium]